MDSTRLIELFQAGGIVMYPLLVCSIFVVSIAIERHWHYKKAETFQVYKEKCLCLLREGEQYNLQEEAGPIGILIEETYEWNELEQAVQLQLFESSAASLVARFKERLSYLETVVTLAPLLGLLGTVVGMIQSFQVLAVKSGQMQAITGGVGEALVATATGLCVAVFALLCHAWLCYRLERLIGDLEECGAALLKGTAMKTRGRKCETA